MRIIGIAGVIGSGKDTLAKFITEQAIARNRDKTVVVLHVAFADALKRMLLPLGFPEEVLWGPSDRRAWVHPVLNVSARQVLQHVGTEGCRGLDADFWVKAWKDTVDQLETGTYTYDRTRGAVPMATPFEMHRLVLVPDMRFENEQKELHGRDNAYTVLIERGLQPIGGGETTSVPLHASELWCREAASRCVDEVVCNDFSLDALYVKAGEILDRVYQ